MNPVRSHPLALIGVLLLAAVAIVVPFFSSDYLASLMTLVLITALLATSVNMPAGEVGLVSMGHAGISASAAYGIAYGVKHDFGLGGQLLLALALTVLVSAIFALTTMRTNGIVFLMITLALGVMVYGIALKWSSVTGGQSGLTGITRPASLANGRTFYYVVLAICVLAVILLRALARSPFGLTMRGVRDNENRMASLGYSIAPVKFVTLMISGLVAGTAGVLLVWHSEFMSPAAAAFDKSAMAVVIIIIGGTGTVLGPLYGSILVVGIQFWLSSYLERWPTLLGALFIAVVILMPGGIARVSSLAGGIRHRYRSQPIFRALFPGVPRDGTTPNSAGSTPQNHQSDQSADDERSLSRAHSQVDNPADQSESAASPNERTTQ